MKINGWWRTWIFLSVLWAVIVSISSIYIWVYNGYNNEIAEDYLIQKELTHAEKDKITYEPNGSPVVITGGNRFYFKNGMTEDEKNDFGMRYHDKGREIKINERKMFFSILSLVIITPALILCVLGMSIAWVIKGFRN